MTTPARRRRTRTVIDHADLANLDFVSSGHIGFSPDSHVHAGAAYPQTILTPVGFAPADIALRTADAYLDDTAEVDEEARAVYYGRIGEKYDTATVRLRVVTAATFLTYGEVAICTGTPGLGAGVKLTRCGWANAVSAFQVGGAQTISVSFTVPGAGAHVWLAWYQKVDGGQGGTLASFDPATADHLESGLGEFKATTRLSTMADGTQFGILGKAVEPLWAVVGMGNA